MRKNRHIHLIGMGASGSLLALKLLDAGFKNITWEDEDSNIVAWKASTGAIYPANSTKFGDDALCHTAWAEDLSNIIPFVEQSTYWFNHKSPPHEGKYRITKSSPSGLNMAELPSYHLNAQKLVPHVRDRLALTRLELGELRPHKRENVLFIHTHGSTHRLSHFYWGWAVRVKLDYDTAVFGGERRPCFYFREGRYVMAYAYPIPDTPYWYAGSSIIKQRLGKEKSLDIWSKYSRWQDNFERLSNSEVKVVDHGQAIEGWRPACGDSEWVTRKGNQIFLRPLWNSGLRHFPHQWWGVEKHLNA